jgi:hypothetical protein
MKDVSDECIKISSDNLPVQQTPNPEAHDPDAVPPFCEHSAEVRHVPLYPLLP